MTGSGKRQRRQWLHACHQWIGLGLGLLFVVLGLTGSLLVFYQELDQGFRPGAKPPTRALADVVAAIHQAEPGRDGSWRIEMPSSAEAPISARYMKPAEMAVRDFAPLILRLDPQSLSVVERYFWGDNFWTWIYNLHYSLLLGATGKTLLGITALLLGLLSLSGLLLWWPAPGQWRSALRIKSGAVWKRRVYDLHVKPGVYVALPMLIILLTGLILVMPSWFKPGISWFSPLTVTNPQPGNLRLESGLISADAALALARRHFPQAEVRWVETPSPTQPVWRIQMRQAGEPNQRFPRTQVWIDAHSGATMALRDPQNNSAGDSIFDWLHPLHNGEAFGLPGRIVVFLLGLMPLLAFVSGLIRWRHKARAIRSPAAKRPDRP